MFGERAGTGVGWLGFLTATVLAVPAAAQAADAYVDLDTGLDANPCTEAQPCLTIGKGVMTATDAAAVRVDPDTYSASVSLGGGKSLIAQDFVGEVGGEAVVDGGSSTALTAGDAGTVSGFTFTANTAASTPVVRLEGSVNFMSNTVDVLGTGAFGIYVVTPPTATVSILGNTVLGDNTSRQVAIRNETNNTLTIEDNDIGAPGEGLNVGLAVLDSQDATITGNSFRAMFQSATDIGSPITLENAVATITGNSVRENGTGVVAGVNVFDTNVLTDTGADLHRNEFYGQGGWPGVYVSDVRGSVTLDGDLIAGSVPALNVEDFAPDPGPDLAMTSATIVPGSGAAIELAAADLTIDSSILTGAITASAGGTCAVTFSRGPTATAGGNGCANFRTTANPGFVSPPFGDVHLAPSSAMIDAGNPAVPPGGALDIDGDARALPGCPGDPARRDIGADEFSGTRDCDPPQTRIKGKRAWNGARARFKLRASETGPTFRCKLDKRRYRRCKARYKTPKLEPGKHKLQANATDAAGNEDPSAAVKRFKIIAD